MQQAQRERTIAMLKEGKLDITVATDVAARGRTWSASATC